MKERIHWIDVFKGILIIMVVIHHTPFNVSGAFPLWGYECWNSLIVACFMPAFFVVTGYCTNFNICFGQFLWKNIKTILIPCFCLYYFNHWLQDIKNLCFDEGSWVTWSHFFSPGIRTFFKEGGYYWFLSSLFLSKIIFYLISRYIRGMWYQVFSTLFLVIIGIVCAEQGLGKNFFYWQHAFALTIFLPVGIFLKVYHQTIERFVWIFIVAYFFYSILIFVS